MCWIMLVVNLAKSAVAWGRKSQWGIRMTCAPFNSISGRVHSVCKQHDFKGGP